MPKVKPRSAITSTRCQLCVMDCLLATSPSVPQKVALCRFVSMAPLCEMGATPTVFTMHIISA